MSDVFWMQNLYRSLIASGMVAAALSIPQPAVAEALPSASDLVWSPSGRQAVFAKVADLLPDSDCPTELYELDLDATAIRQLLQAKPNRWEPENDLSCFYDPKYSTDGQHIYFVTPSWATSGAIQALDRKTGKIAFIIDGGPYLVIGSGPQKGMLLVVRRKYPENVDNGAVEEIDLVSPHSGKAIQGSPRIEIILRNSLGLSGLQKDLNELEGWQSW